MALWDTQVSDMSVVEALDWFKSLGGGEEAERRRGEEEQASHDGRSAVGGQPSAVVSAVVLTERQRLIASQIFKEIMARLQFMRDVGLDYLTLSRAATSLSGNHSASGWLPRLGRN
jgi:excinuclease UvrABC ATPase subunit